MTFLDQHFSIQQRNSLNVSKESYKDIFITIV